MFLYLLMPDTMWRALIFIAVGFVGLFLPFSVFQFSNISPR